MLFENFISRRYLISRENKALVSIITIISILGVSVGVAALITVISVMDGFDASLISKMTGTYSHIEVRPLSGTIQDYTDLANLVKRVPGIIAAAPVIRRQTFLQRSTGIETPKVGAVIEGIDLTQEKKVTTTLHHVKGKASLGPREIVMGKILAHRLHIFPNTPGYDTVYAITKLAKTPNGPWAKINALKVTGTFESGLYDVDSNFAFVSMETMQKMYLMGDRVDFVHARVKNPRDVSKYVGELTRELPRGYNIRTWKGLSPDFFFALKLEKLAMFVILMLIVLVASFNIIGTLIMVTTQKTREIGILMSMGTDRRGIMRIFLLHGIVIGFLGTGLGVLLGLLLCFITSKIKFSLPEAVYGIQTLPVLVTPLTIMIIVVSSFLLCVVASVIPAIQASRMNPVEALRYE